MEINNGYLNESYPLMTNDVKIKTIPRIKTLLITISLILFSVFAYSYTGLIDNIKPSSFKLMISGKPKTVTKTFDEPWTTEKNTISISSGSYDSVASFVNKYITNVNEIKNLGGCDTYKVVGKCLSGYELHFVDSATFTQSGLTINEWSEHIESLGIDQFNDFMHNKQQLFVPDLSPHYNALVKDDISFTKRLSSSFGSSTLDIAHIGIQLADAQTIFEIVGPSKSLSSDILSNFKEFQYEECPIAHSLPFSLEYYSTLYAINLHDSKTYVDSMTSWSKNSGMYIPMAIQTTVPTGSLSTVKNTLDLLNVITGAKLTYSSNDEGTCNVAYLNLLPNDNAFSAQIIYVENNANSDDYSPTVADWEDQIAQSHKDLLDDGNGWNRYLDTHLGYVIIDSNECDSLYSYVSDAISSNDGKFTYSLRVTSTSGIGIHFYTGTSGIKSWEINVGGCVVNTDLSTTDICGCLPSNNNVEFIEKEGYSCSVNSFDVDYE
mmetsp:Transcript_15240/g.13773  ORF Transcript_15240/g.13773 Transcript_15240/m.13773 type:complete len:491 (-) Transcript_15240:20-1492(-)